MAGLLCAWVLSACGGPRMQTYFVKSGITPEEHRRNDYECRRDAAMVVTDYYAYVSQSRIAADPDMYARCLEARGYQRERRPPPSPTP